MLDNISITIEHEAFIRINKFAEKQVRNRSNAIEYLIKTFIDENGNIKEVPSLTKVRV